MKRIKLIKTEAEYQDALAVVDELLSAGEEALTLEQLDDLELLSKLIEDYENEHFPVPLPDPIEAVKFRMEQKGLTQKDMQQYLGSASKVSEILSGKRPLSLTMIRKLHAGLGIPAEVLMQAPGKTIPEENHVMHDYPFNEMFKNGYFSWFFGKLNEAKIYREELLNQFFKNFRTRSHCLCKKSEGQYNYYALEAWQCHICNRLEKVNVPIALYDSSVLTDEFLQSVGKLSYLEDGPKQAIELLNKCGIYVVFEPHLSKTLLDGAAFILDGHPVIALTLRYDRVDNFWFTLMHELAHIKLHLCDENSVFFDDIENCQNSSVEIEQEANRLAEELLIPASIWVAAENQLLQTRDKEIVRAFAEKYQLSKEIVAGRIRNRTHDYKRFPDLHKKIKPQLQTFK